MDEYKIIEDTKAWVGFGDKEGCIWVYCRCLKCGRYIKRGQCFSNGFGKIKLKNFICKVHGEIEPFYIIN
jgi:hypothetical protein